VKITGLNSVLFDIRKFGAEAEKDIESVTEQTARNIEKYAKQSVPTDTGKLGQSIQAVKDTPLQWKIEAGGVIAPYGPFIEFGTGGLVEVPDELKDQAIKFIGKGIKQINLRPRPYLYPALIRGRSEYLEKLKKVLSKYAKVK